MKIKTLNLQVYLTNICNLKCTYCFETRTKENLDYIEFVKSYDMLIRFFKPYFISLVFCGGEPLCKIGLIEDIIEYTSKEKNISISYSLTTNGTIMNNKILKCIINNNIDISISIDGMDEIQNKNRKFLDGSNTFDTVMHSIKCLKNNNISFATKSTIDDIMYIKEIYYFISDKCQPNRIFLTEKVANNELLLDKKNIDEYIIKWKNILDSEFSNFLDSQLWRLENFTIYLAKIISGNKTKSYCNACETTFCISVSGKLYPCYRMCEYNEMEILNFSSSDFLYYKKINNRYSCKDCYLKFFCGGGCLANDIKYGSGIKNNYKQDCLLMEIYYQLSLYLLQKVSQLSEKKLSKFFGDLYLR